MYECVHIHDMYTHMRAPGSWQRLNGEMLDYYDDALVAPSDSKHTHLMFYLAQRRYILYLVLFLWYKRYRFVIRTQHMRVIIRNRTGNFVYFLHIHVFFG